MNNFLLLLLLLFYINSLNNIDDKSGEYFYHLLSKLN